VSTFDRGQNWLTHLVFEHMAQHLFRQLTASRPEVSFVQVGANDGNRADPIKDFVKGAAWTGLMIEPVPFVFASLEQVFGSQSSRLILENCAVGPFNGRATFYACREPHSPLSSFDRGTITKHREWALSVGLPDPETCIEEIDVPVWTLESLCNKHDIRGPDVLVTDTEGYDCKAVLSLDIGKRLPPIIYFEHAHCPDEDTEALRETLTKLEYRLMTDQYNGLAIRASEPGDLSLISTFEAILTDVVNFHAAPTAAVPSQ
jgi:FkbM family methyltransferase